MPGSSQSAILPVRIDQEQVEEWISIPIDPLLFSLCPIKPAAQAQLLAQ